MVPSLSNFFLVNKFDSIVFNSTPKDATTKKTYGSKYKKNIKNY
jgi:hypothetical protein